MNLSSKSASAEVEVRARVLLVDDEPALLDGLRRQLRRSFDVSTAEGGEEALELMQEGEPYAVVLSDMRMPGMDGAAFLAVVRERYPDTVRLLLTGQADMQSTIAAINDGQIYRFLSKPCPAETIQTALHDAAKLYRQITAERDVLERTLRGAVQALLDALSLASPKAFSRAVRVSQLVGELAETIDVRLDWQLGISGQLAQLGAVTVPTAVLEKLDAGLPLTEDETAMVEAVPQVSQRLIAEIPRLGPLATAIGQQGLRYDGKRSRPGDPVGEDLPLAARLLKMALDIDRMRSQRLPAPTILKQLREDAGAYDPRLLDLWEQSHTDPVAAESTPVLLEIEDLETGMVLVEEVLNVRGVVLLGRGSSVTEALLQRIRNHAKQGEVKGPVLVTHAARS
jgi:response regulator RpfG family c-di-GMP phosphodiesterase